ncbi:ferrochelatase (macronuclear) [Tetrahymena thermophila SB210]|uniref:Ferrochelatase n=1 Tax=Tetrahymena thermophila (strain SB210) TaxID=312017 RepID=I7MET3_TETTS|nr:ferrochelatase [Tetrahymena thermophila SB210]EAR97552.2 ferrochelatase [Tetrahymena thermophila SB210]|eukprot:XP_001017797.2 ferrochelatase [Tetrahymena thermophila SB210]
MLSQIFSRTFSSSKQQAKTAVFMLNLGGPNSLEEVSPFLERFFADSTVIRIPFGLGPKIGKLRGPAKVTKQYEAIGGRSPIQDWTRKQGEKMVEKLDQISPDTAPHIYFPAFRYGLPLYTESIKECIEKNPTVEKFVFFSQYPQYSCTTAGNNIREALKHLKEQYKNHGKTIHVIDRWYNHPGYVKTISRLLSEDLKNNFKEEDRDNVLILFSAHSLPFDFVKQGDTYPYEIGTTANLVIQEAKLKNPHRVVWQSKVGFQQWLAPNTMHALEQASNQGWKNVILVPLGFTSDHLETLYELDLEYIKESQEKLKFNKIIRARSLNDDQQFCDSLADIVSQNLKTDAYKSPNLKLRCPDCKIPECNLLSAV